MGARKKRYEMRRADMATSRRENGLRKMHERARRDERMKGLIKTMKFPYTPVVMSWLSARLEKPSSKITEADVSQVLAGS